VSGTSQDPLPTEPRVRRRKPSPLDDSFLDTLAETLSQEHFSVKALKQRAIERTQAASGRQDTIAPVAATGPCGPRSSDECDLEDSPRISRLNLAVQLPEIFPDDPTRSRYIIGEILGEGGTGRVFSGIDSNLKRPVAIKFLSTPDTLPGEQTAEFIREGQVAAKLEHPSIIPVYDMDCTSDGKVYLVMRKVTGETLYDLIEREALSTDSTSALSINAKLNIVLRICEALSFAHARGIVHRDIKPGNVMIGCHGEVVVVDWGTASACGADGSAQGCLMGTPAYMSPEQARCERADSRSDIYCVGATLFYMLLLRWPTEADDLDTFWEKKCAGIVDPPTREERRLIPAPLLAIAMKALRADPAERYSTIDAMASDLANYQAGQAVSAYPDTLWAFARRWYRRNRLLCWSSAVLLAGIVFFGELLYRERAREVAAWGPPVETVRFSDAETEWRNEWGLEDQRPLGQYGCRVEEEGYIVLVRKKQLAGSVAIEFDTPPLARGGMGRIYIQWIEQAAWDEKRNELIRSPESTFYSFILGRQFTAIEHGRAFLDFSPVSLEPGRNYRVRAEMDQYELSLFLDGQRVGHARQDLFHGPGHLMLRREYAGRTFANVRLYFKGVAEKVSALAVPDTFHKDGLYDRAVHYYDEVLRSHPDKDLAREALYKKGLCLYRQRRHEQAFAVWRALWGTPLEPSVAYWERERAYEAGDHAAVLADLRGRFPSAGAEERRKMTAQWDCMVHHLESGAASREVLEGYLSIWEEFLQQDPLGQVVAATLLDRLERYEEIADRCPYAVTLCALTLVRLNRADEMLRRYPGYVWLSCAVLLDQGRYQEVLERYPFMTGECVTAMIRSGRASQALERYADDAGYRNEALLALGRWHEVLEAPARPLPRQLADQRAWALIHAGRYGEAACEAHLPLPRLWAHTLQGREPGEIPGGTDLLTAYAKSFEAFLKGGPAPLAIPPRKLWLDLNETNQDAYHEIPWAQYLLVPLAGELRGDASAMHGLVERIADERRRYQAGTLYGTAAYVVGKLSEEEFREQPCKQFVEGRWLFARALRADREKRSAEALDLYRQYVEMPFAQKGFQWLVHRFAQWRVEQLETRGSPAR